MKCALSDITIGTHGSINVNTYRRTSSKHEQSIGRCLVKYVYAYLQLSRQHIHMKAFIVLNYLPNVNLYSFYY